LFFWGLDRSHTDIWQFDDDGNEGPKFWKDLFDDAVFKCYLTKRWEALIAPGMPLNKEAIYDFIAATDALISEAVVRQETVSQTTGEFDQQIIEIKAFISDRMDWISSQLTDTSLCDDITTPPLVISKINYNPMVNAALDSDDFEFIEIKNNSSSTVNLTGVYFGGLGFTYQFENDATVSGQGSIYLANKTETFVQRYDFEPFGEFSRNLSNASEDLILRDAYGNIIDEVTYSDDTPWPTDADGNGSFLKLVSLNLDNSLAASWIAQEDTIDNLSVNAAQFGSFLSLSPNPVTDKLNITTNRGEISSIKLWSINGKLYQTYDTNSRQVQLDLSGFDIGLYILQIQTNNETQYKKIIKN